jgi:hypothetical protein
MSGVVGFVIVNFDIYISRRVSLFSIMIPRQEVTRPDGGTISKSPSTLVRGLL